MNKTNFSRERCFPIALSGMSLEVHFPANSASEEWAPELPEELPSDGKPMPLSLLAWRMAEPDAREWATLGELDPWTLRPTRSATSLRGHEKAVREEAMRACFGNTAWFDLLPQLVDYDVSVSGVLASGRRVVLDDATLSQLVVDLATDTARTYDGRSVWHALTVSA